MRLPSHISSFFLIHRPAHATPSYTHFTFLFPSHLSFSLCHSFIYPFHLSLSFSSIVQLASLLYIPFSPFTFFLIHRPTRVTPSYFTFLFPSHPSFSLCHSSYTLFTFFLIHPSSLCHSFRYPFHLSLSFSSSSLCRSFIYPFHLSHSFSASYTRFIFLSQFSLHIYCSTHVTPSYTLFTFFLAL
ncbi:hypothetical protein EV424DRAFT_1420741 [Suillus variegatus]|nr:hypothetical protein EV424DRAFT_1420741 [Suillus variegatus]